MRVTRSRILKWEHDRALAAFPPGSAIRLTGPCACAKKWTGRNGLVVRPSSDNTDYIVQIEGEDDEQFVCARGMERKADR